MQIPGNLPFSPTHLGPLTREPDTSNPSANEPRTEDRHGRRAADLPGRERPAPLARNAPDGTDPEAWKLLSGAERTALSEMQIPAELTYGRGGNVQDAAAPPRGLHLDVRV